MLWKKYQGTKPMKSESSGAERGQTVVEQLFVQYTFLPFFTVPVSSFSVTVAVPDGVTLTVGA